MGWNAHKGAGETGERKNVDYFCQNPEVIILGQTNLKLRSNNSS